MLFDNSLRKTKYKSNNENYSYKKKLIKEKKIDKDFINKIKHLTLEDLIYLKLDSLSISLKGKLLGFSILKHFPEICTEAFTRYALSVTKNKRDASVILGTSKQNLNNMIKKYKINLENKNENK